MLRRTEIIEILKQINPIQLENDGPTSVLFVDSNKTKAFTLSGDKELITVTTGKFIFKRKYHINRNEL